MSMEPFPLCHETLAAPPEPPLCFLPDDHPFRRLSPTSARVRYKIHTQTFTETEMSRQTVGNLSVVGTRHAQCGVKYSAPQ